MGLFQNLERLPEVQPEMLLAVLLRNLVVVRQKQWGLPGNFVAEERILRKKAFLDIDWDWRSFRPAVERILVVMNPARSLNRLKELASAHHRHLAVWSSRISFCELIQQV
jgi:hypothetical protein